VKIDIDEYYLKTPLTKLDVSGCKKLTDLFVETELFLENKIIGLEKTSILRLAPQGGYLLTESQDPFFI